MNSVPRLCNHTRPAAAREWNRNGSEVDSWSNELVASHFASNGDVSTEAEEPPHDAWRGLLLSNYW